MFSVLVLGVHILRLLDILNGQGNLHVYTTQIDREAFFSNLVTSRGFEQHLLSAVASMVKDERTFCS